jgi:hypothetical protein
MTTAAMMPQVKILELCLTGGAGMLTKTGVGADAATG